MTVETPTTSWSTPITLSEQTMYQAQQGSVFLSFENSAPEDVSDGLLLLEGETIIVPANNKVCWVLAGVQSAVLWSGKFIS